MMILKNIYDLIISRFIYLEKSVFIWRKIRVIPKDRLLFWQLIKLQVKIIKPYIVHWPRHFLILPMIQKNFLNCFCLFTEQQRPVLLSKIWLIREEFLIL